MSILYLVSKAAATRSTTSSLIHDQSSSNIHPSPQQTDTCCELKCAGNATLLILHVDLRAYCKPGSTDKLYKSIRSKVKSQGYKRLQLKWGRHVIRTDAVVDFLSVWDAANIVHHQQQGGTTVVLFSVLTTQIETKTYLKRNTILNLKLSWPKTNNNCN